MENYSKQKVKHDHLKVQRRVSVAKETAVRFYYGEHTHTHVRSSKCEES